MSEWIDVAGDREIGVNECAVVDVGARAVVVFNVEGELLAVEDECSHEAYPLSEGEVDGDVITCALHDARFSLRTGEVLTGPAGRPVAVFPVRIEDGRVQVRATPVEPPQG